MGFGTVLQKRTAWRTPLFTVAAWQLLFGGVPFVLLALLYEPQPFAGFTIHGVLGMTYVVLIATVVGYWLWFRVIEMVPAGIASSSVLPVPLIGLTLSTLILGESVAWPDLAALVCMTAALAFIVPPPRFRAAP